MDEPIRNASGERLDALWTAGSDDSDLAVIIGHGVTANKDRDWAVTLTERLRRAGIASLRFSFAGNGASEGDFRACTVSKEVEDLGAVLDRLADRRVVYAGHSMGGAVGVLRAARDPRIRYLVSLAGMVDTADFAQRKFGDLVPGRDLMWDKPECPLSQEFLDDMQRVGSVEPLATSIEIPWLLVHGTADTVVPHEESVRMTRLGGERVSWCSIEGADHLFSGDHEGAMAEAVVDWLRRVTGASC